MHIHIFDNWVAGLMNSRIVNDAVTTAAVVERRMMQDDDPVR
jgi:hypothetical protein